MIRCFLKLLKPIASPMFIPEYCISLPIRVWSVLIAIIGYFALFYGLITFVGPGIISTYLVLMLILAIMTTRLMAPVMFVVGYYLNFILLSFNDYNASEYIAPMLIGLFIFMLISYLIPTLIYKWVKVKQANIILTEEKKIYIKALEKVRQMGEIRSVCSRCSSLEIKNGNWLSAIEYTRRLKDNPINITICPSCINEIKKRKGK